MATNMMKPSLLLSTLKTQSTALQPRLLALPQLRPASTSQTPSTAPPSSFPPAPRRRAVTVTNDTGAVPWANLTTGEKAARATQQSFNFSLILLGLGATCAVGAVLYLEVFSTDSKTAVFNRAADMVRADRACRALLTGHESGGKREIEAHGEPSWSRWARNRHISSRTEVDKAGIEHMHMHFYVSGEAAEGTVRVHMTRRKGQGDFEYRLLALDVPGKPRQLVVDGDAKADQRWQGKMFGVKWN